MAITSFSVDLLVVTPDQLRKINIKLTKDKDDKGVVDWFMNFGLEERAKTTEAFHEVIKLTVKLKQTPEVHTKAAQTADKGLDSGQTSQAFIAGDAAKLASEGEISKQSAQAEARKVVTVRA